MKKTYIIISIIATFLFVNCNKTTTKLEYSLQSAGDNRIELEKVVNHYSNNEKDSLKLKAAIFLIENMVGHYTVTGKDIDKYRVYGNKALQEGYIKQDINTEGVVTQEHHDSISYFSRKIFDILISHSLDDKNDSLQIEDISTLTADYIIKHIDASFKIKDQAPWLQDIDFNYFLEYILPYRIENEYVDLWRDSIDLPEIYYNLIEYYENINHNIMQTGLFLDMHKEPDFDRDFIKQFLNIDFNTNCYEAHISSVFKLRTMGIPAALDFIPAHPNRNGRHYWCAILSPNIKDGSRNLFQHYSAAKIYRHTYSRHTHLQNNETEYIPLLFCNPFIKDVTDEYLKTTDLIVSIEREPLCAPTYSYLCVFNNRQWEPIAISPFSKKNIKFQKMGKNVLYQPIYYRGKLKHSLNYPFIVDSNGNIHYLKPCYDKKIAITLTRKYPMKKIVYDYYASLDKLIIEGSNSPDLGFDTLHCLDIEEYNTASLKLDSNTHYQYYRLSNKKQKPAHIAEIYLLDKNGKQTACVSSQDFVAAFDNNPLSNIVLRENEKILINLNSPKFVDKIICSPRSDGNWIYPGDSYELLYYDIDGWHSLGKQIAKDCKLYYNNLPSGALYWLRNLTTGIEERPFTIENEKIRFW